MLLQGTNTRIFDCDAFELTEFICDDGFSLTFRISKVLCCQITRLTGTECCRLRGTQECFCSTHMHDSAGSLSDDCHIVRKKWKSNTFLQFCTCSLVRRSQAAEACDFDPSLLLDHTSIAVLQHLLRSVNTFSWSGCPLMHMCNYSALCLFAATMSCCTSQLRTCSPNTWSAFYWSSGRRQNGTLRVVCILIVFIFFFAGSHLIASAHRELPVRGSSQDVAQVHHKCCHCHSDAKGQSETSPELMFFKYN